MTWKYSPEDFFKDKAFYPDEDSCDWAARVANRIKEERDREKREKMAVVFARRHKNNPNFWDVWTIECDPSVTYRARLYDIEDISRGEPPK